MTTGRRRAGAAAQAGSCSAETAARAAGEDDLTAWMERYGEELVRHLTRMLGGRDAAEDALQEVWITAHRSPPDRTPAGERSVKAWLYRVATNAALDRLARCRRRARALDGKETRVLPDASPAPDAWMERLGEDGRREVRRAVSGLPYKQRRAVRLRWLEGKEYAAVARELCSSEASARANVHHGMKKLYRELHDLWQREVGG